MLLQSQLITLQKSYYQWILLSHFKFSICRGGKQNNEDNSSELQNTGYKEITSGTIYLKLL